MGRYRAAEKLYGVDLRAGANGAPERQDSVVLLDRSRPTEEVTPKGVVIDEVLVAMALVPTYMCS